MKVSKKVRVAAMGAAAAAALFASAGSALAVGAYGAGPTPDGCYGDMNFYSTYLNFSVHAGSTACTATLLVDENGSASDVSVAYLVPHGSVASGNYSLGVDTRDYRICISDASTATPLCSNWYS